MTGGPARRLDESERRLVTLVDALPELVWRSDMGAHWTWSGPQWTRYTGLTAEDSRALGWVRAIHPDDRATVIAFWSDAPHGGALEAEYRIRQASDGRFGWFKTQATACRDEAGTIVEWLGLATDISEVRALREQHSLYRSEPQQRLRNLLGIMRSVVRRTAQTSESIDDYTTHLEGRFDALARVETLIARSPDGGVSLDTLIAEELRVFGGREGGPVDISGPPLAFRPGAVEIFALAIHELAANAMKFGALSPRGGALKIAWEVLSGDPPRLLLSWKEFGVAGLAGMPDRRGFGIDTLERVLGYELKAASAWTIEPDGLLCTIEIPLTDRIR